MSEASVKNTIVREHLAASPIVAVFQAKTYGSEKLSNEAAEQAIMEDALNKVDAMYKGGVRTFEFLARGYKDAPLDTDSPQGLEQGADFSGDKTYIGHVLKAIDALVASGNYPDAIFGVGTISNRHMMEKVASNPNISFAMTANWPDKIYLDIAKQHGVPILATTSHAADVGIVGKDGEFVEPPKALHGNDMIDPAHLAELRKEGIEDIFKVSNFSETAERRAVMQRKTKPQNGVADTWAGAVQKGALTPEQKVAFGLIATAEAIKASYEDGVVPQGKKYFVATTGGVDAKTTPFLANHTSAEFQQTIEDILGDPFKAKIINGILKHVTLGAGGTSLVKRYESAIAEGKPADEAKLLLEQDAAAAVAQGVKQAPGISR